MKKFFAFSAVVLMLCATMTTTSCSTEKSIVKAFEKKGYQMGTLTPQQQLAVAPVLSGFPAYSQSAIGYVVVDNAITFVYNLDNAAWDSYCYALTNAGFSNMGTGFIRADKGVGYTFNVATSVAEVYKQPFRFVTFTAVPF